MQELFHFRLDLESRTSGSLLDHRRGPHLHPPAHDPHVDIRKALSKSHCAQPLLPQDPGVVNRGNGREERVVPTYESTARCSDQGYAGCGSLDIPKRSDAIDFSRDMYRVPVSCKNIVFSTSLQQELSTHAVSVLTEQSISAMYPCTPQDAIAHLHLDFPSHRVLCKGTPHIDCIGIGSMSLGKCGGRNETDTRRVVSDCHAD